MSSIGEIRQITDNTHLNFYELDCVNRKGSHFPYYVASRARSTEHLVINEPDRTPDGVIVYSLYGPERDRVVLVRQYRYPIGGYVYEFPAGLVEPGEDYRVGAIREMKEETGLDFTPVEAPEGYEHAFYTTDGMTDERCSMVFGYAEGQPDLEGLEDTEELQVVLADRDEVRRILREEAVAVVCAYQLMHFVHEKDPFGFLKQSDEE